MSYTALINTPIAVNLLLAANYTGWTQDGAIATHVTCQAGFTTLASYPVVAGHIYKVSYAVLSVSSGYVQVQVGGTAGASRTTADLYVETLTAGANGFVKFYSNANCQVSGFNIIDTTDLVGTTFVFSAKSGKWSDWRTYYPDFAQSLYKNFYSFKDGAMYNHLNGSSSTNTFYGVHYPSIIRYVDNRPSEISRSFLSLSIQSNELMITGDDGITTSLGQVSELSAQDFVKDYLSDGTSSINVTTIEGIYSANILRDKNTGTVENGDLLKGSYLILTLISTTDEPLLLYSVNIISKRSPIGSR